MHEKNNRDYAENCYHYIPWYWLSYVNCLLLSFWTEVNIFRGKGVQNFLTEGKLSPMPLAS